MLKKLKRASTLKLQYVVDVHVRKANITNSVAPTAGRLSLVLTRSGKKPRSTAQAEWANDVATWPNECLSFRASLYREKSGRMQSKIYRLSAVSELKSKTVAVFELDIGQYVDLTLDTQQLILPATKSHDNTAMLKLSIRVAMDTRDGPSSDTSSASDLSDISVDLPKLASRPTLAPFPMSPVHEGNEDATPHSRNGELSDVHREQDLSGFEELERKEDEDEQDEDDNSTKLRDVLHASAQRLQITESALEEKTQRLSMVEEHVRELQTELANARFQQEESAIQAKDAAHSAALASLRQEYMMAAAAHEQELEALRQSGSSSDAKLLELQQELEAKEAEHAAGAATHEQELEALRQQSGSSSEEVEDMQRQISQLNSQLDTLKEKAREIVGKNKEALQAKEEEHAAALEAALEGQESETAASFGTQISELQQALEAKEAEHVAAAATHKQELEAKEAEHAAGAATHEQELEALRQQSGSSSGAKLLELQQELEAKEAEYAAAATAANLLVKEANAAKSAAGEAATSADATTEDLQRKLDSLQDALEAKTLALRRMEEGMASPRSTAEKKGQMDGLREAMEVNRQATRDQHKQHQHQLDREQQAKVQLQAKVEELEQRVQELERQGDEASRQCADNEETIATLQEQEAVLKHEWGQVNSMLCERKDELEKELVAAKLQLAEMGTAADVKEGGGGGSSWWTPSKR
jgi:chromosome segregation ATPase